MQLLPLRQELFPGFLILGVRDTGVYGANLGTLRGIKPPDTLGAFIGRDNIDCLAFAYGFVLTFRFTGATANTFVGNFVGHSFATSFIAEKFCFNMSLFPPGL